MNECLGGCGYKVVRFESWEEFRSSPESRVQEHFIFRGQRQSSWQLQSPWDRKISWMVPTQVHGPIQNYFVAGAYEANRDQSLRHFKRSALPILGPAAARMMTDDEWWALGRHYGLISPLLDWTRLPLVAAFFAFIDLSLYLLSDGASADRPEEQLRSTPYVAVWRLHCPSCVFVPGEFEMVQVNVGFEKRQQAQAGVFTRLSDGKHFDVETCLHDRQRLDALIRFDIPSKSVGPALEQLHDEDIHYASLFPDFSGAAMYANTRRFVKPEALNAILGLSG